MNKKIILFFALFLLIGMSAIAVTMPSFFKNISTKVVQIIAPQQAETPTPSSLKKPVVPATTFEKIDLERFNNLITQAEVDSIRAKNPTGWMDKCKVFANNRAIEKYAAGK